MGPRLKQEFLVLIEDAVADTGATLEKSASEVAHYAAERADHLSSIVGEPGFDEAVKAERDNVALFAAMSAVENADAADARLKGMLQGALAMGAKLIRSVI